MTTQTPTRRIVMGHGRSLMVGMGVLGVLVLSWLRWNQPALGGLFDYFPLYHGAQALLDHGDAYYQDPALAGWGRPAAIGNAYPLHGVLILGVPFQWLSPAVAGVSYLAVCGLAWVGAIVYSRASTTWLLWWPMWDALRIQQASAAVTVAAILAWGAARRGNPWVFVASLVVMSVKPQQTIILILALAWMRRDWWWQILLGFLVTGAVSIALQPNWPAEWVEAVSRRDALLTEELWLTMLLLPVSALLFIRGWHMPAFAVASTGAGPWPVAGDYVASAWPLGLDRLRGMALGVVSSLAYLAPYVALRAGIAGEHLDPYWARPAALTLGIALVSVVLPCRSASERVLEPRGRIPAG